jgi:type II secretory pathway pseudopilin PulG
VTLLELIVVIALLGLILAIAAPAIVFPSEKKESELTTIIGAARRAAVLRGEPVTLTVAGAAWRIASDAAPSAAPIAAGSLASSLGTFRVHVSPLGTCLPDADNGAGSSNWNALDCRFASGPEARTP